MAINFGISAAVATPFFPDGSIDNGRLVRHATNLLEEGCCALTLFGTTGEGAAIDLEERQMVVSWLVQAGILPEKIILSVAACSIGEAVAQATQGVNIACRALLVAPPFYFKSVSDNGIFDWYASLFDRIGPNCPPVILYHIPQVTGVPLSISLVRRLKEAYPSFVYGVKDSSGDWENSQALLQYSDIAVLIGDERHLAKATRLGGSGAISGLANILAPQLIDLFESANDNGQIDTLVDAIVALPVTAAIKALIAAKRDDPAWCHMRPPLEAIGVKEAGQLKGIYRSMGFAHQEKLREADVSTTRNQHPDQTSPSGL